MALRAENAQHQGQIDAGTKGRVKGHSFERDLAASINRLSFEVIVPTSNSEHTFVGNPAFLLLQYIANDLGVSILQAKAWWLGGLATSGQGDELTDENGCVVTKSKSDIVVGITTDTGEKKIGVSVKTCAKATPTNDQMFFTTASAFCTLLRTNGIIVSEVAEDGLCRFCGDVGYRPVDHMTHDELANRLSDPNRYYWEELSIEARLAWKMIFAEHQDDISRLLFQKAYKNDAFAPDYLLHQTTQYDDFEHCPLALFSIDEIVSLSHHYAGFILCPYVIRKGTYKADNSTHYAPRFGYIQFQRGGQKQHPTQLQFNLKAGYFNHLNETFSNE